jgi:hypothetical protein
MSDITLAPFMKTTAEKRQPVCTNLICSDGGGGGVSEWYS